MYKPVRTIALLAVMVFPGLAVGDHLQDGLDAYDVGDYEKALAVCMPYAEAGDRAGQFCIGRLYANGFGVPMDDDEALKWYGLAAEQGHSEAQFNLGVMHANGWGVPMSEEEAAKWYQLAAEQGLVIAQTSLANVYHSGRGVEQSLVAAYKWFAIAAELGDNNATFKRDAVAAELSTDELQSAQAMTQTWLGSFDGEELKVGRID
ncbi:MAG: sel1 repeat family protein [Gammaproteobacteria bacterium]|nr:sel1 repeat family protein [Gammaproteobacteria bacterium]